MKKLLIICGFMLTWVAAWADNQRTTDHLEIGEIQLQLGGTYGTLSIDLKGQNSYTAFGFDLYLPAGYEYDLNGSTDWNKAIQAKVEKYSIYPYTEDRDGDKSYSHTLSANIQQDGALRITTLSNNSEAFRSSEGTIVKVYVKTTPYAKPGSASIQIKNCFFVTPAGVQYDTDDITISDKVSATSTTSIPFSISAANQLSTCILPFDAAIPDGVKAYECSDVETEDAETYLVLTEANSFEAYTPYIVYSESGYSGNLNGTVDASKYPQEGYVTRGLLNGSIEPQMISAGYVMQNKDDGAMFYNVDGKSFLIPAGKCWLSSTVQEAKAVRFRSSDAAGISTIMESANENGVIYNLLGLKVNRINPGHIYIKGNKKYIVK